MASSVVNHEGSASRMKAGRSPVRIPCVAHTAPVNLVKDDLPRLNTSQNRNQRKAQLSHSTPKT